MLHWACWLVVYPLLVFIRPVPPLLSQQPGGASQIVFGEAEPTKSSNNYQRPAGAQNLGNIINPDRPSSKVSAPPGGRSQIIFG